MPDKVFIDTNVLIYGYSEDEPNKRQRAIDCVRSGEAWISTQVLNETIRDLRFDNVPFGRTQFAPTLWTKSVTVGAQSLRPPIDWDIILTQVPYYLKCPRGSQNWPIVNRV